MHSGLSATSCVSSTRWLKPSFTESCNTFPSFVLPFSWSQSHQHMGSYADAIVAFTLWTNMGQRSVATKSTKRYTRVPGRFFQDLVAMLVLTSTYKTSSRSAVFSIISHFTPICVSEWWAFPPLARQLFSLFLICGLELSENQMVESIHMKYNSKAFDGRCVLRWIKN